MHFFTTLYVFMTALFAALIMVPVLRRWALEKNELDQPDERKTHRDATPRLGGIAIAMAFIFSMLVYGDMVREVRGIMAGALIIFFTGLVDDLHGLSPRRKFLGEIAGCLVAMAVGHLYIVRLGDLFGLGSITLPFWAAIPFTLFAVVGVINALNLIDGLDGLAGGVSVIALVAFASLGYFSQMPEVLFLCAGLLGAVLGFLKYNFWPARIFMGDAGSLTVGFVLGFLAIFLTQPPSGSVGPIVPVIILGLPVIDTLWVMIRRFILEKKSPFAPDRTHVHHKFLDLGFHHRFTVIIIYGISLFWAAVSVVFHRAPEYLLLWPYILVSVLSYMALRHILNNRSKFDLLSFDSSRGIRESDIYRKVERRLAVIEPLLVIAILTFLFIAVSRGHDVGEFLLQVLLACFAGSLVFLLMTRKVRENFSLLLYYFLGMILIISVENSGQEKVFSYFRVDNLSDFLFVALLLLTVFRIILRPGEFFLGTIDFMILGTSILFALIIPQIEVLADLPGVLIKGIILFLALKFIASEGVLQRRVMVGALVSAVLVVAARTHLG